MGFSVRANSSSALLAVNQQIYSQLKPLVYHQRTIYNTYDHDAPNVLALPADAAIRKRVIINDSGYELGPTVVDGECWIFGSYQNANVNADDYDFVVLPGAIESIELPSAQCWLICEAATGSTAEGKFAIVEYK